MSNLFSHSSAKKPLSETDRLQWLRLSRTENVGPITFYRLIEHYGSPQEALNALPELAKRGGRKKPLIAPNMDAITSEYDALQKLGGDIICVLDETYPLALGAIDDAPPVISVLGNTQLLNQNCIAMVGSRNASINGRKFASKLAGELGHRGQVITSGLARGIDTAAHEGSLETGTIAVVAGGIDVVYPPENQKLYEQIIERGAVIAESALGQKPFAQSFPKRNRIVSGLSRGVIVVEANMRSGSLITARLAGEQGREMYAVPGHPMDPRAAGTNHLIREGAVLVRSADDILEGLMDFTGQNLRDSSPQKSAYFDAVPASEEPPANGHDLITQNLSFTPTGIDELVRITHMSVGQVQAILLDLELAGTIKRLPAGKVSLTAE